MTKKLLSLFALGLILGTFTGGTAAQTQTGNYNYGELLQKAVYFYDAQRSGELPASNRVQWRGDSAVNDGADVGHDLTGGFYDAGDHVKWGLPLAYSLTMMAWGADQFEQGYTDSGQLQYMLDNIRWGTDYLLKAHTAPNELWVQVGKAGPGNVDNDHNDWLSSEVIQVGRPSFKIDTTCPGSDVAAETAAAMAAASIIFSDSDPAYAAELITHAEQLYTFADTYRAEYSSHTSAAGDCLPADHVADYYNSWGGYQDELVWGAIWLYRATGDATYLTKAETEYGIMGGIGGGWTHDWSGKSYGSALLLAQATDDAQYQNGMETYLDWWLPGGGVTYTPGGLAYLAEWASLRYVSNTTMLALIYSDYMEANNLDQTKMAAYHDFAVDQINYALGDNPDGRSYVVGYGNNPPDMPHHTTAHGGWLNDVYSPTENQHTLYGALVGGPDANDQAPGLTDRNEYIQNEVAISYNAAFVGSAARLYEEYGGAPLASFPPSVTPEDEIYIDESTNNVANGTEVTLDFINKSASPARETNDLKARYFFTLDSGSINDVSVSTSASQCTGAAASAPMVADASTDLYYIEFDCSGTNIYPGGATVFHKEVTFQLTNSTGWDSTNDPADNIALYSGNTLIWGTEPTGTTSPVATATPVVVIPPLYSDATYNVTFEITWDNDTHPHPDGVASFPSGSGSYGPHFSGIVGGVHSSDVTFWELGGSASAGVQQVAETGSKAGMEAEVNAAIAAGDAWNLISQSGMVVPNSINFDINVDTYSPLVSLVSMLAPSPDWFVGVSNLSLWQNGEWVPSLAIDLYPYDAGTKNGGDYDYGYPATNPQGVITDLTGVSPFSGEPLGRILFNLDGIVVTPQPTDTPMPMPQVTPTPSPTSAPPPAGNVFINGDFAGGLTPWWDYVDTATGAAGTGAVTNGAYCMTITDQGANVWDILLGQSDFALTGGVDYDISFDAWGTGVSSAVVWVGENIDPAYPTFLLETFTLSAEPQLFSYTFTPGNDTTLGGFDFQMGSAGTGDVCFDDISLSPQGTTEPNPVPLTVSLQDGGTATHHAAWLLAVVVLIGVVSAVIVGRRA